MNETQEGMDFLQELLNRSIELDFPTLENLYAESGSKVSDWGEDVYLRVEAHVLYTFA